MPNLNLGVCKINFLLIFVGKKRDESKAFKYGEQPLNYDLRWTGPHEKQSNAGYFWKMRLSRHNPIQEVRTSVLQSH